MLVVAAVSVPGSCLAVLPEAGTYWTPNASGRGYYLDVQGSKMALIECGPIGAATPSMMWQCVVGGGAVRDDGLSNFDFIPLPATGRAPLHWATFQLDRIRSENGTTSAEKYADVDLYAVGVNELTVCHRNLSQGATGGCETLFRMNFGYGETAPMFGDLSGEWVFVDRDAATPTHRFDFALTSTNEMCTAQGSVTRYADAARNAELCCQTGYPGSDTPAGAQRAGCELRVGGVEILAFNREDIGIGQIVAYRGRLPLRADEPYRGVQRIYGFRLPADGTQGQ